MKKIHFLSVLIILGFTVNGQIINIPDAYFKGSLLAANTGVSYALNSYGNNMKVDTNSNGEIELSEAALVYSLNLYSNVYLNPGNIVSLEGIQNFTNLKVLKCWNNHITSLNLSGLNHLEELYCDNNQITTITTTGLTALKKFDCRSNQISTIDTSTLVSLEEFTCTSNLLTSINTTPLSNLKSYYCNYNNLGSLDVSSLQNLRVLVCNNSQLTSLNIANIASLQEVICSENPLNTLNLAGLSGLHYLEAVNNLFSTIDVQPLTAIQSLDLSNNPLTNLNINGLTTLSQLHIVNTLLQTIDCSQTGVQQLWCIDSPNITYINVKNNIISYSDPDMLFFAFRFENLPLLTGICLDNGEQNNLSLTSYNNSGNVIVYTGTNCETVLTINPQATTDFKFNDYLSFYPNPVKTELTVNLKNDIQISSILIYNMLGQLVQKVPNCNATYPIQINVTKFETGTYLMNFTTNKGSFIQKLIKI